MASYIEFRTNRKSIVDEIITLISSHYTEPYMHLAHTHLHTLLALTHYTLANIHIQFNLLNYFKKYCLLTWYVKFLSPTHKSPTAAMLVSIFVQNVNVIFGRKEIYIGMNNENENENVHTDVFCK